MRENLKAAEYRKVTVSFSFLLNTSALFTQPIQRWRRTARIVRMLCAVCIALRKYAMDAGLLENYMVNVTRKARADGDVDDLTFNLKDFKIRKEVSEMCF